MGLEGNLRELALQEVLQLLAHTRKSGVLSVSAPLTGLTARVTFEGGAVVDGDLVGDDQFTESHRDDKARQVEGVVLELLTWADGQFAFAPRANDAPRVSTGVRLNTDALLMEGARRVDAWTRLSDRIPNARAVPEFVESDGQAPPLNLQPHHWAVLTGVDGQRDLLALSATLGRDLLETAETVYGLIETGLLKLSETARFTRSRATPLSVPVISLEHQSLDLWIPAETESDLDGPRDDEIFDPILVGVLTPDGLPRFRTPAASPVLTEGVATSLATHSTTAASIATSFTVAADAAIRHREAGDTAARRGDFAAALHNWNVALETGASGTHVDHVREAITLVTRLSELLDVQS